ncbi:MAG: hypothetical protein V1824_02415 [archaeon]
MNPVKPAEPIKISEYRKHLIEYEPKTVKHKDLESVHKNFIKKIARIEENLNEMKNQQTSEILGNLTEKSVEILSQLITKYEKRVDAEIKITNHEQGFLGSIASDLFETLHEINLLATEVRKIPEDFKDNRERELKVLKIKFDEYEKLGNVSLDSQKNTVLKDAIKNRIKELGNTK